MALLGSAGAAGCVGAADDGGGGGGGGGGGSGDVDRITCSAELGITGTFAVGDPRPAEIMGCWPIGTWTFTATVGASNCPAAPPLASQYQFRGERDLTSEDPDYTWVYTYLTDPTDTMVRVSVSSGGGGECEGSIQLFSADGKTLTLLKPALQEDGVTLTGFGQYEIHTLDQRL
ncbi:MAG: hypothetical protein KBG28_20320 [Kofleriaceae bacterium]|nr:hypothetical protein [Kofleriaceae bacterium]MBP9206329.1 hypothetical protein [Kofleriaceae bacterium]